MSHIIFRLLAGEVTALKEAASVAAQNINRLNTEIAEYQRIQDVSIGAGICRLFSQFQLEGSVIWQKLVKNHFTPIFPDWGYFMFIKKYYATF